MASPPETVTITIPPDISLLTGPQLLGLFFNWGLFGVLGTQVYIYYLCFPKDSRWIKGLVYGLFLAEIVQTCMVSSDAFHWLVYGWGRPDKLQDYQLTWFDVPIMGGLISATVQIFFAWRIWKLGQSMILSGAIVFLGLVQCSAGFATGVKQKLLPVGGELGSLFPTVSVWLGCSALVDIIIAVSMTYLLIRAKSNFYTTNYLLTRLIRLTVETGTVTATAATVAVILFNLFKTNYLHMCPAITLAKLYTNTLMVVFNQRIFISGSNSLATSGSGSGRVEMEPGDYYSSRLRGVMSPQTGSRTLAITSFHDTFKEDHVAREIPLETLSIHNDGTLGRPEKFHGSEV